MKIYRVVPSSFLTGERINSTKLTGIEDIYYKMGYTSFLGKRGFHMYNNIATSITEEGKYFFVFFDDALFQGCNLVGGFHRLRMDTCSIIEYDIPEDIILKHIGYGDYTEGISIEYKVETFIEKSDLGGEVITTEDVPKERKILTLTDILIEELKRMKEYGFSSFDDMYFYINYFRSSDLASLTDDNEKVKKGIEQSLFYLAFKQEKGEVIKTPYITKKIIPLNMNFISQNLRSQERIIEYYQAMGIDCRISKEHNEFKGELVYCVQTEEKDKQKVKSLLKQAKYI